MREFAFYEVNKKLIKQIDFAGTADFGYLLPTYTHISHILCFGETQKLLNLKNMCFIWN